MASKSSYTKDEPAKTQIQCRHGTELEHDAVRLVFDCRGCKGRADLGDERCMRGALGAVGREFGVSTLMLSGYIETKYEGPVVEALRRGARILEEVQRFSRREPWEDRSLKGKVEPSGLKKTCAQCPGNPGTLFGRMRDEGQDSLEKLFGAYNSALQRAGAVNEGKFCAVCRETTRGDLLYLKGLLDELRSFVLYTAFKVVEGSG